MSERAVARPGDALALARRRAASGKVQILVAQLAFLGIGMVIAIVLARALGPAQLGAYGVVITFLTWLEMTIGGGMPGATAKVLAQHPAAAGAVEQTARLLCVGMALLLFAAGWVAAPWLATWLHLPDGAWLLRLAFADLPLMAAFFAAQGMLLGSRRFGLYSAGLALMSVAKLAAVLVLLALGYGVGGALAAHVAGTAAGLAFVLVRVPPTRAAPSRRLARAILRVAPVLVAYGVGIQLLTNLNLWQLKVVSPPDSVAAGLLVAALNVARVLTVIPAAVSDVVFATVSHAVAAGEPADASRHVRDAIRFALLLAAPATALLIADAAAIVDLLYAEAYAGSAVLVQLLALVFALLAILDVLARAKMAHAATGPMPALVGALTIAALIAGWLLIPRAGAVGAVLAQLLPLLLGVLLVGLLAARRFGAFLEAAASLRILGMAALVGLVAHLIPASGLLLLPQLLLCGLLYLGGLGLLGELRADDLAAFGLRRKGARPG